MKGGGVKCRGGEMRMRMKRRGKILMYGNRQWERDVKSAEVTGCTYTSGVNLVVFLFVYLFIYLFYSKGRSSRGKI